MNAPPRFAPLLTASIVIIVFLTMLLVEKMRPLRRPVEDKVRRNVRNVTTGAIAFVVVVPLQLLVLVPVSRWMLAHHAGLLNLVDVPSSFRVGTSLLFLDYTLWIWHWANHRVPFLWRFHLVHHVDRDLDASTALRFHFGEHALSTLYRAAQIVVIGASPFEVWLWQAILFAAILFHHSNIEIPIIWERRFVRLVVTPRMHGIHHSDVRTETDSNWSSILTIWDRLHRTLHLAVPQQEITIGVPAYARAEDITIGRILLLPFRRRPQDWRHPDGNPSRRGFSAREERLAE